MNNFMDTGFRDRKFGAFSSSEDPQKLADTVKGAIKLVGGLIAYFGYASLTGDVNTVADQVGTAVTLGISFYGAVMTLYGLLKKVVVKVSAK
jgi:hypothetical protein